jgi:hypothetical protein
MTQTAMLRTDKKTGELRKPNEFEIKHWQSVRAIEGKTAPVAPVINDLNVCFRVLKYRSELIFNFNKKVEADRIEFVLDKRNTDVVKLLCCYLTSSVDEGRKMDESFSLSKGIMLRGLNGVGKSNLFKVVANTRGERHDRSEVTDLKKLRQLGWGDRVSFDTFLLQNSFSCLAIQHEYQRDGDKALDKYLAHVPMHFSDLGEEDIATNYGNKTNVMEQIISHRYNLFLDYGIKTFFDTNILDGDTLEKKYGPRIRERLREMCNVWTFPVELHKSFRK